MKNLKILVIACCISLTSLAYGDVDDFIETIEPECKECRGKIDTGPTYVNIDILQKGKTIRSLDLYAWKADAIVRIISGLSVKGNFLVGGGDARFYNIGGAVGFCFPFFDWLTLFPNVGYGRGSFRSKLDLPIEIDIPLVGKMETLIKNVHERVRSHGPLIGIDASFKIDPKWRVVFVFQYAWSHVSSHFRNSKNELIPINATYKTRTSGPNLAAILEHDIADHWSLSFGVGYNLTLSKDKEGLRAKGAKAGLVYWF